MFLIIRYSINSFVYLLFYDLYNYYHCLLTPTYELCNFQRDLQRYPITKNKQEEIDKTNHAY